MNIELDGRYVLGPFIEKESGRGLGSSLRMERWQGLCPLMELKEDRLDLGPSWSSRRGGGLATSGVTDEAWA